MLILTRCTDPSVALVVVAESTSRKSQKSTGFDMSCSLVHDTCKYMSDTVTAVTIQSHLDVAKGLTVRQGVLYFKSLELMFH